MKVTNLQVVVVMMVVTMKTFFPIFAKVTHDKVTVVDYIILDPTSAELEKKIIALRKEKSELQKKLEGIRFNNRFMKN